MIYIIRNNQQFGPYDEPTLVSYVNNGQILLCDKAQDTTTNEINSVKVLLRKKGFKTKVQHAGNLSKQLRNIGFELIIPKSSFVNRQWISDKKLLSLGVIGLYPLLLQFVPFAGIPFVLHYLIALYFSLVWGIIFYYFFKTPQVSPKTTILCFFLTQALVFIVWDLFGISKYIPMYHLLESPYPFKILGYTFGVGLMEELVKLLPLIYICQKAKEPIIPQTLVFYGLMSGIAFGVYEGVQYQLENNVEFDYSMSYFLNIARMTSLPFLHAVWCGIAGYFISFAHLYPKYRISLFFLAWGIPMVLHGIYDSFCDTQLCFFISVPVMIISVILLMTYLKQGINYQSKLRN